MPESIGYRLALDNAQYVKGMKEAQSEVRELSVATRSGNLGALSGELQMASGSLSTFNAGTLNAKGGIMDLFTSMRSGSLAGLTAAFGGATAVIGAFTLANATAQSVLSNYAPYDSLVRGLKTLEGTAAATTARIEKMREVAKVPGLGFEEAIRADIRLRAVGFSAKDSEDALRSFGNALATVGGGKADLDGVILGLSQIAAKGKVSAEEINQIAERVPQVRAAMKAAFGTADTEVLQKQNISATEFVRRLTDELAKLPAVTGGAQNSLDNYSDSWTALKVTATEFGVSMASGWMDNMSKVMAGARRDLNSLKEAMGVKTPGLEGKDGQTEKQRAAAKAAEAQAATEIAAAKAEADAAMATAQFWEQKQAERTAFLKGEAEKRLEIEKSAQDKINSASEKAFAAKLSQQANLERQIAAKQAEGPSGAEAVHNAKDITVRETIATRTAEILTLQRQLRDLQASAAEKAEREAEATARKAEAEQKTLAVREKAAATFNAENALLEARAAGNAKLVTQLERQKAVEATKQALINDQGVDAATAARMAERRQLLEEAVTKREANPNRIRIANAEQSAQRREEMKSAADKAREARRNGVDAAKQGLANIAANSSPKPPKDHGEAISKKLDKIATISNQLDKIGLA